MSSDHFADVFPVVMDFQAGEMPTGKKLTAQSDQIDTAFSQVTAGIGDPWDTQAHTYTGGDFILSPANLGQVNLSRILGPSGYISPSGVSLSHNTGNTITVTLSSGMSQWCLGFPLIEASSSVGINSGLSDITTLSWGSDIVVTTDSDGILGSRKTDITDADEAGDFHVDFYTGVITAYSTSSSSIVLTISNANIFAAGPPWATHNVIPTWEEGTVLCAVAFSHSVGGVNYYDVTLPAVRKTPRIGSSTVIGAGRVYNGSSSSFVSTNIDSPASGLNYRLPLALTSANGSGTALSSGDAIPSGYIYLWDELGNRIVPGCTFYYRTATQVRVGLSSSLTTGSSSYRIITAGCSVAEAVNYLMNVVRDNRHVGMTEGATATSTLAYNMPLSHEYLTDLWTVCSRHYSYGNTDAFRFRKSEYATNVHPQYLHRSGYLSNDLSGNTANAMRGNLVFSKESTFELGSPDGFDTETYGIYWGSGGSEDCSIRYVGGENSGVGSKLYFGHPDIGANPHPTSNVYGALACITYGGGPLYLRGRNTSSITDYQGGTLAFDLRRGNEMNYLKLLAGDRDGSYDPANLPAQLNQGSSWSTALSVTPDLSNRLAPEQTREFRFRGAPKLSSALNSGIESSGEFQYYFTSPSIVGADFLNVYSNAIFFSEQGDGKVTSFHERGSDWMNDSSETDIPSAILYIPDSGYGSRYELTIYENAGSGDSTYTPLKIGNKYGTEMRAQTLSFLATGSASSSDVSLHGDDRVDISTGTSGISTWTSGNISVNAHSSLDIDSTSNLTIDSATQIDMGSSGALNLTSTGITALQSSNTGGIRLTAGSASSSAKLWFIRSATSDNKIFMGTASYSDPGASNIVIESSGDITIDSSGNSSNGINLLSSGFGNFLVERDLTLSTEDGDVLIQTEDGSELQLNAPQGHVWIKSSSENRVIYLDSPRSGDYSAPSPGNLGGIIIPHMPSASSSANIVWSASTGRIYYVTSSLRYKEDVRSISDASWLHSLRAVSFRPKDKEEGNRKIFGLIAEEVFDIEEAKDIVDLDKDGNPNSIQYTQLIAPMILEIQNQRKEIEKLKKLIKS